MNTSKDFWSWFETLDLGVRKISFRKTFEYLDTRPSPIVIVETGCARQPGNWQGDGQSTLLFDRYCQHRGRGSSVFSVDIDPEAVARCRQMVSETVQVSANDSVHWLYHLRSKLVQPVSLLYLDSYDVDFDHVWPSAAHHLKELAAAGTMIDADTLVVVDDAPAHALVMPVDNQYQMVNTPQPGGKGRLVAQYAQAVGAQELFAHYQAGWTGLAP